MNVHGESGHVESDRVRNGGIGRIGCGAGHHDARIGRGSGPDRQILKSNFDVALGKLQPLAQIQYCIGTRFLAIYIGR